jgi:ribonuclease-3
VPETRSKPEHSGADLPIEALEKKIGVKFKNRKTIEEAMTHKSYAMETGQGPFNERMEFLGDSILNAAVTDLLFKRYPDEDEGKLSKYKSLLVSKPSLVKWAREMKLGAYVRLSESEDSTGGRDRDSILANAMEAMIGAIFLDQGFEKAHKFVVDKFSQKKRIVETDYKSKLQEIVQKKHGIPPTYVLVDEEGPDHDKTFHMQVLVKKKALGRGAGKSKKESEQNAAREALRKIRLSESAGSK